MRIITAKHLGMCGGVRRALKRAQEIGDPTATTIKGEIVHNARVNQTMAELGFTIDSERDRHRLPETPAVLITAHGTSERMKTRFRQAGRTVLDATCPLVRKIHRLATQRAEKGWFVILIGQPGHAEVLGVVEDLERYAIVDSVRHVGTYAARRLAIICQSTTSPMLAEQITQRIETRNAHAEIIFDNTICAPTRRRQQAVTDLLNQVDALVVVGDEGSNNARGLADLAARRGIGSQLVSGPEQLDETALAGCSTVGLTAGASTPDEVIDAVGRRLAQLAAGAPTRQISGDATRSSLPPAAEA